MSSASAPALSPRVEHAWRVLHEVLDPEVPAISVTDLGTNATAVTSEVHGSTAVPLLIVLTALGVVFAGWKLRTLAITGTD